MAKVITILFVIGLCILLWATVLSKDNSKHSGPSSYKYMNEKIDTFATQYAKQHNMTLINVGLFPELLENPHLKDSTVFGFWLTSNENIELDECRIAITKLVNDFWQLVKNDPAANESLKASKNNSQRNPSLRIEHLGIKIVYWTKDNTRQLPPYIAQVHFYHGKFHYYEADPETQALKLVLEEPYNAGN